MHAYVVRRLLLAVPTLLLISVLSFALVNLMPGDTITSQLADSPTFRSEDLDELRHRLGLDRPVTVRYLDWLSGVVRGDLGKSLWSSRSVSDEIVRALPITLELAIIAFVMSSILGVTLGVISAVRQDTPIDYAVRLLSIGGLSLPNFWIGTLVVVLGAKYFDYLPPLIYVPFTEEPLENLRQFLVPGAILAVYLSASTMRMTRSAMLEVLRQDYIRTAWSKGLKERVVISRHALKNALMPVITISGTQLAVLLSGSVIVEIIFNLPGLGRVMFDAVLRRDFIMLQGVVLFIGAVFVLMNLVIDLAYGWLNPQVRY